MHFSIFAASLLQASSLALAIGLSGCGAKCGNYCDTVEIYWESSTQSAACSSTDFSKLQATCWECVEDYGYSASDCPVLSYCEDQ